VTRFSFSGHPNCSGKSYIDAITYVIHLNCDSTRAWTTKIDTELTQNTHQRKPFNDHQKVPNTSQLQQGPAKLPSALQGDAIVQPTIWIPLV
jgi:hypothetical protein